MDRADSDYQEEGGSSQDRYESDFINDGKEDYEHEGGK